MGNVTVELSVVEAFQVVAAVSHRLGYFEGTARDMLAVRQEAGIDKPDQYETVVATAIAQLRRVERALDAALMETPTHVPDDGCGIPVPA